MRDNDFVNGASQRKRHSISNVRNRGKKKTAGKVPNNEMVRLNKGGNQDDNIQEICGK